MYKKLTFLLIISGINAFSQNLNFINKPDKPIARGGSSIVKSTGNRTFFISNGFSTTSQTTSEIERYSPETDMWSIFQTSVPTIAKVYGNSEITPNNMLYILNGITSNNSINDKIEMININNGNLTVSSKTNPNPVYSAGSDYFSSGILIFGGCADKFNAVYSKKFYTMSLDGTFAPLADMPVGLETQGKVLVGNGENLYVFGGYKETNFVAENFESLTPNTTFALTDWINVAETGTKLYNTKQFNTNKYAEVTAFNSVVAGQEASNKVWLISNPLSALSTDQVFLNFGTRDGYDNGATLEAYLITNWTGDITTSTKTLLSANIAGGTTTGYAVNFTDSGIIPLSGNLNNFRIAFKYTGGYSPQKTTTFQIDNVRVYKTTVSNIIYKYSFSSGNNTWETLNTILPQSLSAYSIATDSSSKAYITGDYNNQTFTGVFDSTTETFTPLTQTNMIGRRHHNSSILDNNLYIMGGNSNAFISSAKASTQSVDLTTLSTKDIKNSQFIIYPNPADKTINIGNGVKTAVIYTAEGKKIDTKIENNTIDISKLTTGTYIIIGETNNGKTLKTKFIKK